MASPQAPRFRDHFPVELPAPGSLSLAVFPSTDHAQLLAAARDWLEQHECVPASLSIEEDRKLLIGLKDDADWDAVYRLLTPLHAYLRTLLQDPTLTLTSWVTAHLHANLEYNNDLICNAIVQDLRAFDVHGLANSHLMVQTHKEEYRARPHFKGASYRCSDDGVRRVTGEGDASPVDAFVRPAVRRLVALLDVVWDKDSAIALFESRGPTPLAQVIDRLRGPHITSSSTRAPEIVHNIRKTDGIDTLVLTVRLFQSLVHDLTQPDWLNEIALEGRYVQDASKGVPIRQDSPLLTLQPLRAALIEKMRQMLPYLAVEIHVRRMGYTPEERRAVWIRDDAARRHLVQHLITIPGVLIDMSREPMRPWKGMRFFHGTDYAALQDAKKEFKVFDFVEVVHGYDAGGVAQVLRVNVTDNAETSLRIQFSTGSRQEIDIPASACRLIADESTSRQFETKCQLSWNVLPDGVQLTAFTTPYMTKAFNYGGPTTRVFTYRLKVDGTQLRLLDLRNDYDFTSHKTPVDVFRKISELSGISHINTRNRVPQAIQLYQLFRGTGIDGMILNTDLEWIWFDPPSVLEWEQPPPGTMLERLFNDRGDTRGVVHESIHKENTEAITVERLQSLLDEPRIAMTKRVVRVGDIPHARWTLDRTGDAYANQYLLQHTQEVSPAAVWTPIQDIKHDEKIQLYRVDMADLWRAFAPNHDPRRFADLYMGATITEGIYNGMLPYRILLDVLGGMNKWNTLISQSFYDMAHTIVVIYTLLVGTKADVMQEERDRIKEAIVRQRSPGDYFTRMRQLLERTTNTLLRALEPNLQFAEEEWESIKNKMPVRTVLCVRLPNGYQQLIPPLQTDAASLMPSYEDHPASHALPPSLKPAGRRVTATLRGFADRPVVQPIDERESKKMKVGGRAQVFA
jgi:hypothetical protein